jgi:Heavy metal binding domain
MKRCSRATAGLISIVALLTGCAGPQVPPDSSASPASAQARESAPQVATVSLEDETTRAITARLKETRTSQDKIDNHAGHIAQPAATPSRKSDETIMIYTCPMHPKIQQRQPGDCPICAMTLMEK